MTADACDQGHVQVVPHPELPELSHTFQTTPSQKSGTIDIAEDTTNEGIMEGIDEVELQMSTSDLVPECVGSAAKLFAHLHTNGVLVSGIPAAATPLSDYDPMWLVHSHPSIFPHGTGACPEGMSLKTWAKGILCRYPKTHQYAQNIGFITDAFNIIQRHEAYKHVAVQMRMISPGMTSGIHGLTEVTLLQEVMKVLTTKKAGTEYKKAVASLPRAAQNLLNCVKRTGARRVIGSPHSFRSLRCKVLGANVLRGHYTCMLNLCPTESGSHWTFKLAGEEFSFDSFGAPDQQRPNTTKVMATISANPKACADFIHAYFNAFCEVFIGWPMGRFASSNKVRDTTTYQTEA
ncbi:hypothetical protein CEUSTIGMA_g3219.t1 [Chlamydomonas eustigma]|uniref:Helitron helicase-like domain-containing protein n=1 Tax=Chlamydomonas eustigma TaxID=1157962 RepID=A0A250WYB6_9CHLO|nr:hypothetical protein CEUSTIGMA_g3219.t1 [Chlamydomonas eustigma]|eukprot:GAX75776.1 hypothetical protein CEUSTIGMA_g3219.t1 [Chlamydomonas eustigma]